MRCYKAVIEEAQLMAASPEFVLEFLKKRAYRSKAEAVHDPVNEEVENALRSRAHPLIDLGLARFGRYYSTVRPLFDCARPGHAIRLAVLSNTSIGSERGNHFPVSPFSADWSEPALFCDKEHSAQWIVVAVPEELHALFENPTLDDYFLCHVLKRSEPWDCISDERLVSIITILKNNARMRTPRQDKWMSADAEYDYDSVFDAAWRLAEIVQPTERWAVALGWLYERLVPHSSSVGEPLSVASRWLVNSSDLESIKQETEKNQSGWLSDKQRIRKGLGRLALSKDAGLLSGLLAENDPALRCAAYSDGRLTPEQLRAAYEKDGELVLNEALYNPWLWHSAPIREVLRSIAWSVVRKGSSDLLAANIYNKTHQQMQKDHPDWFKDDEDEPKIDGEAGPATKADLNSLGESLRSDASKLGNRFIMLLCLVLGAILASLVRC